MNWNILLLLAAVLLNSSVASAQNIERLIEHLDKAIKQKERGDRWRGEQQHYRPDQPAEAFSATPPRSRASIEDAILRFQIAGMRYGSLISLKEITSKHPHVRCEATTRIPGYTWCFGSEDGREARGTQKITLSALLDDNYVIRYLNRSFYPAFFDQEEIEVETTRLSRMLRMEPARLVNVSLDDWGVGIIAAWGNVQLSELSPTEKRQIMTGDANLQQFIVDMIGNYKRTLEKDYPIYKVVGGKGILWMASRNANGRGFKRFFVVDASIFDNLTDTALAQGDTRSESKPITSGPQTVGDQSREQGEQARKQPTPPISKPQQIPQGQDVSGTGVSEALNAVQREAKIPSTISSSEVRSTGEAAALIAPAPQSPTLKREETPKTTLPDTARTVPEQDAHHGAILAVGATFSFLVLALFLLWARKSRDLPHNQQSLESTPPESLTKPLRPVTTTLAISAVSVKSVRVPEFRNLTFSLDTDNGLLFDDRYCLVRYLTVNVAPHGAGFEVVGGKHRARYTVNDLIAIWQLEETEKLAIGKTLLRSGVRAVGWKLVHGSNRSGQSVGLGSMVLDMAFGGGEKEAYSVLALAFIDGTVLRVEGKNRDILPFVERLTSGRKELIEDAEQAMEDFLKSVSVIVEDGARALPELSDQILKKIEKAVQAKLDVERGKNLEARSTAREVLRSLYVEIVSDVRTSKYAYACLLREGVNVPNAQELVFLDYDYLRRLELPSFQLN